MSDNLKNTELFKDITEDNFDEIIKQDHHKLVIFSATWCGPCNMLKSQMKNNAENFKNSNVVIYNCDIDKSSSIVERYGIKSVPTAIFFDKEGNKTHTLPGCSQKMFEILAMVQKIT